VFAVLDPEDILYTWHAGAAWWEQHQRSLGMAQQLAESGFASLREFRRVHEEAQDRVAQSRRLLERSLRLLESARRLLNEKVDS
jgi:hypothetical protein